MLIVGLNDFRGPSQCKEFYKTLCESPDIVKSFYFLFPEQVLINLVVCWFCS